MDCDQDEHQLAFTQNAPAHTHTYRLHRQMLPNFLVVILLCCFSASCIDSLVSLLFLLLASSFSFAASPLCTKGGVREGGARRLIASLLCVTAFATLKINEWKSQRSRVLVWTFFKARLFSAVHLCIHTHAQQRRRLLTQDLWKTTMTSTPSSQRIRYSPRTRHYFSQNSSALHDSMGMLAAI